MLSPGRAIFDLAVICPIRMAPHEIIRALVDFDDRESCQKQASSGSLFLGENKMILGRVGLKSSCSTLNSGSMMS